MTASIIITRLATSLHPPLVHFPIAFLLIAPFLPRSAARIVLTLGVVGAVLATASGWFMDTPKPSLSLEYAWHKWLGVALTVLALLAWWKLDLSHWQARFALAALAVLVGITGHLGGRMVWE